MVITTKAYDEYHEGQHKKRIDWTADSVFATLHLALAFVATNTGFAAIAATEIGDAAYTKGGIAVQNVVISSTGNIEKITFDRLEFTDAGVIAASSLVLRNTSFAGDLLMLHIDLGTTETSTGAGTWHITPNATNGIARYGDTI